jgi:hypothetical protein
MNSFRQLPPVLRVASLLRLLFPLGLVATFAYLVTAGLLSSAHVEVDASRLAIIAVNLSLLGLGCALVVRTYRARIRQQGRGSFPLESWQSQVRTILALTAVPVCALVLVVIISPTSRAFQIVFPVSIIGAITLPVVAFSIGMGIGQAARD